MAWYGWLLTGIVAGMVGMYFMMSPKIGDEIHMRKAKNKNGNFDLKNIFTKKKKDV